MDALANCFWLFAGWTDPMSPWRVAAPLRPWRTSQEVWLRCLSCGGSTLLTCWGSCWKHMNVARSWDAPLMWVFRLSKLAHAQIVGSVQCWVLLSLMSDWCTDKSNEYFWALHLEMIPRLSAVTVGKRLGNDEFAHNLCPHLAFSWTGWVCKDELNIYI